jgi:hypothetical protein
MRSKSDFWLDLHGLADDLEKEGRDDQERIAALAQVLESMPPATLSVYCSNLEAVTTSLNKLLTRCRQIKVPDASGGDHCQS